jgi:hypothetical protein
MSFPSLIKYIIKLINSGSRIACVAGLFLGGYLLLVDLSFTGATLTSHALDVARHLQRPGERGLAGVVVLAFSVGGLYTNSNYRLRRKLRHIWNLHRSGLISEKEAEEYRCHWLDKWAGRQTHRRAIEEFLTWARANERLSKNCLTAALGALSGYCSNERALHTTEDPHSR